MIKTDKRKYETVKEIREREAKTQDAALKQKCEARAIEKYTEKTLKEWSRDNQGIWFLPIIDDNGNIEKMLIMRPITRSILSYASTKIADEGLYAFLEQCMRECAIEGDQEILDDDEYFIPAAMKFNGILETKKAALLKR